MRHVDRFGGQLRQYVGEVRPRVQRMSLRRRAQAHQNRGTRKSTVTAYEQPVLAADRQRSNGAFRYVVIDGEPGIAQVASQRRPLVERVRHRLSEGTLRQRTAL